MNIGGHMKRSLFNLLIILLTVSILFAGCTDATHKPNSDSTNTQPPFTLVKETYAENHNYKETLSTKINAQNGLLWYEFEEAENASVLKSSLETARNSIQLRATMVPGQGLNGSGAISFNGTTNAVKLNNDFSTTSQITDSTFLHPAFQHISIMLSIKPEDYEETQLLYEQGDKNNGIAIGLKGTTLQAAVGAGNSKTGTGKVTIIGEYESPEEKKSDWLTVLLTFDGITKEGTACLYIDNMLVAAKDKLGAYIPQTLDAAGLGAAIYGTNVLNYTDAYYAGLMDDLRIFSETVEALGELEDTGLFLQSASHKNYYISVSSGILSCNVMIAPERRAFVLTEGLADATGISFRLTGTNKFIGVKDGTVQLIPMSQNAEEAYKQSVTFYEENSNPESLPSWASSSANAFFLFKTYDKSACLAIDESLGLILTEDTSATNAQFKITGDQTKMFSDVKGAVYYPSYALNAPQFWKWYDHEIINRDMKYASEILGINAFRIWVSYEYWLEDPDHFEKAFKDYLSLGEKWGIRTMVSLFEGCGDSYVYGSYSTWNRRYASKGAAKAGWAITSPSPAIYGNPARWNEPKEFIDWFMERFKDDKNLLCIEVYNEPWGDQRTALALELCSYTVSLQGSVPLTLGSAPSGGHTLVNSAIYGMDFLQYHDNFPGSTTAFQNNATDKIAKAKLANLPVSCTEIQWIGGPSNVNYPVYSNLAPTALKIAEENPEWSPFFWTLMVHPCYLNSYRDNFNMYNGLFNEDGSVNSLKNASAMAGTDLSALGITENKENPYDQESYQYQHLFSDNFMDLKGYKWQLPTTMDASSGALSGNGIAIANDTHFTTISQATVKLADVSHKAGLFFGASDNENGYAAIYDNEEKQIAIYQITNNTWNLLASNPVTIEKAIELQLSYNGQTATVSINSSSVSFDITIENGLIGLVADSACTFDGFMVKG